MQNAIIDAICDVMRLHPEPELTERYIAGIAKGIHLERIFQRELHIPATLLRAGDAYERLRGQMLAEGRRVTASMEEDIWDKAVCAINDRQLKEHSSGRVGRFGCCLCMTAVRRLPDCPCRRADSGTGRTLYGT